MMETKNLRLTTGALGESILEGLQLEYLDGDEVKQTTSPVSALSDYSHRRTDQGIRASWTMPLNGESTRWALTMEGFPETVNQAKDVVVTNRDLRITLTVNYETGQPEIFRHDQPRHENGDIAFGCHRLFTDELLFVNAEIVRLHRLGQRAVHILKSS